MNYGCQASNMVKGHLAQNQMMNGTGFNPQMPPPPDKVSDLPGRTSPIDLSNVELWQEIGMLFKVVHELRMRLKPVMLREADAIDDGVQAIPKAVSSPMREQVEMMASNVSMIREDVQYILDRLEV